MAEEAPEKLVGITGELEALPLGKACRYYENYLDTFQVDLPMAVCFINRVFDEQNQELPEGARRLLEHALRSAVRLSNFDPGILGLGLSSGVAPGVHDLIKVLEGTHVEPELFAQLRKASFKFQGEEIRAICEKVLARHPLAVRYADMLLSLDYYDGIPPSPAVAGFRCPKVLQPLWNKHLFNAYAGLGDADGAWALWEGVKPFADDPFTLAKAAEMHRMRGDTETAVALYDRAIALDAYARPYRLRREELASPFRPDHGLVDRKRVAVYLYSFNKAQILGETLESLRGSAIGAARIKILLNGCTDDSLAVAGRAKALFPENEVEVISLPVNVGAPAARNWLLAQPATRECEYVAFLDDDVYVQPDWLAQLLTVAERDPRIGNVGCKVVFPGQFHLLQYLYRHVSLALPEAVRVSLPTPYQQYDIGLYDVVRETRVVMGCQHLLRTASLADAPAFDIRYSPSQIDDTDHDLQLCLAGWKVFYCGTVTCVHRQGSGTSARSRLSMASQGSILGNDVKFSYKWFDRREELERLDALSLREGA
ncbi:glycosyltransferase family 2 protein [Solidesulfovibrio sp.]|uniref:glycosyltransferase family 2 protein n=1 Tax=Solidesulfovibrio sp. TaxID=2910990 RepID=UPI000EE39479|nr:glycosyltransferase [Solidesulfovibrio sp.]MEA5087601.1 glycosyltransferase [Solidesulfovibrio sp.]HCR13679.1 glycosyltransferase family 2 protein [Desulfovibrio sp.]HML60185.1 glycosyltransferase [Solidesulfovibrio sp.]